MIRSALVDMVVVVYTEFTSACAVVHITDFEAHRVKGGRILP